MLGSLLKKIRGFVRPPASEASRLDPQTALAGLFLEGCYRDGGLTGKERELVDEALVKHLGIDAEAARALRVRAEEVQYQSLTPIGFAMASAKGMDEAAREAALVTLIGLMERDRKLEAMENRLLLSIANCWGIPSGRVKALRAGTAA